MPFGGALPSGTFPSTLNPTSAGGGFNPLALLSSPLAGGLPGFSGQSSATSNAALNQFISSPFNVGTGSLNADATAGVGTAPPGGSVLVGNPALSWGLLAVAVGGGAWLLAQALK